MPKKYIVMAIDLRTSRPVQQSFSHPWSECETIYQEYQKDYDDCRVVIVPAMFEE